MTREFLPAGAIGEKRDREHWPGAKDASAGILGSPATEKHGGSVAGLGLIHTRTSEAPNSVAQCGGG